MALSFSTARNHQKCTTLENLRVYNELARVFVIILKSNQAETRHHISTPNLRNLEAQRGRCLETTHASD